MQQHFVTFLSPGSFVHEETTKPIDTWDVEQATAMSHNIMERHGATPFAFQFSTRERQDNELDSKIVRRSGRYYLGGTVFTLEEIKARNDPNDRILISNMEGNGYERVVENCNSWKATLAMQSNDTVLVSDT